MMAWLPTFFTDTLSLSLTQAAQVGHPWLFDASETPVRHAQALSKTHIFPGFSF